MGTSSGMPTFCPGLRCSLRLGLFLNSGFRVRGFSTHTRQAGEDSSTTAKHIGYSHASLAKSHPRIGAAFHHLQQYNRRGKAVQDIPRDVVPGLAPINV